MHRRWIGRALALALALSPGLAAAADLSDFVKACQESSNHDEALCTCSGKKAQAELSAGGFDLLVAMLAGDDATAERLRGELPVAEVMQAGMFMTRGPAACAREASGG